MQPWPPNRKPAIPKALAGKIKRAQEAVKDKRRSIVYGEREIEKIRARELDTCNRLVAGKLSERSYEAITRSLVDRMERQTQRGPERRAELIVLERQLAELEREIFAQVSTMRPSTGRVPWPRSLPPFQQTAEEYRRLLDQEDARAAERHASDMRKLDREFEEADAAALQAMTNLAESLAEAVSDGKMNKDEALDFIRRLGGGR